MSRIFTEISNIEKNVHKETIISKKKKSFNVINFDLLLRKKMDTSLTLF